MVRYDSLIMILMVCLVFILQKQIRYTISLGVAALVPGFSYGAWTLSRGWYFLPNSVLIKGNIPGRSFSSIANYVLGYDLLTRIQENVHTVKRKRDRKTVSFARCTIQIKIELFNAKPSRLNSLFWGQTPVARVGFEPTTNGL